MAAAPLAAFIPGFGPILSAALGLVGGGLKIGGKYAPSGQNQNIPAQQTELQKQLMGLGVSPQQIQQDLGKASNYNSQYNNLSFKGPGGQGSPLGQIDFSQRYPGLNRIGAIA